MRAHGPVDVCRPPVVAEGRLWNSRARSARPAVSCFWSVGRLSGGDTLVVVAIDRIGRRWPDTIRSICELRDRGVKIRSLAEVEAQWTRYLEADEGSPEAFFGQVLTMFAAWVAPGAGVHQATHQGGTGAGPATGQDPGNQLTGTIPPWLGGLSDLELLRLSDNRLDWTIPEELGGLANLERLDLAGSQLVGCIPRSLRGVTEIDLAEVGRPFCSR